MDGPTIDEVRAAKSQLLERLRGHGQFAGIGIGRRDGRLVVQVNWRSLPSNLADLTRIGDVEIAHREVGDVRAQSALPQED